MSKPDVWMPLYIGDYLGDTMHLTTEQHGAYLLLTMHYWRAGALDDDDDQLAAIAKLPSAAWKRHRKVLVRFFQPADGQWKHKRIDEELGEAESNAQRRTERAKKGAQARWKDAPSNAPSMPEALPEGCASPSPSPTVEDKPSTVDARKRAAPKKPLDPNWTPTAFAPLTKCDEIVGNWPMGRFADELERFRAHHGSRATVMADWQAAWQTWVLNSDKFDKQGGNNGRGNHDINRTTAAAEQAFGPAHTWGDTTF